MVDRQRALPFRAVAGEEHLESMLPQRGREHASDRQVVVDHEHPLLLDVAQPFLPSDRNRVARSRS